MTLLGHMNRAYEYKPPQKLEIGLPALQLRSLRTIPFELLRGDGMEKFVDRPQHFSFVDPPGTYFIFMRTPYIFFRPPTPAYYFCDPPPRIFFFLQFVESIHGFLYKPFPFFNFKKVSPTKL